MRGLLFGVVTTSLFQRKLVCLIHLRLFYDGVCGGVASLEAIL